MQNASHGGSGPPGGDKPKLRLFRSDDDPGYDGDVSPDPVNAAPPPPGAVGTLDWYAARYREHLETRVLADDYSPRRLKCTMGYVASFLDFISPEGRVGSLELVAAKQTQLVAWMLAHYQSWKKGSTRSDALGSVLGCFNWLEEQKILVSPFRRPRHLKFPRTHHRAMRKPHYQAIMREARKCPTSKEFRLIFFAAWNAGVRLIEFRQLEPSEIDWDTGVGRIPPSKHKTGRKTDEDRIFGVGPHLLAVLRGLRDRMKPGQKYLFLAPRGVPWTKDNLGRHYARYREAAGVPENIKMCAVRHGYAVRVLADGETSAKAVADQLGHRGTRMVESIYGAETRHDAALVREIAAKAEKGRRKKPPR